MDSSHCCSRVGVGSNKLKDLQVKETRQAYSLVATDLVVYGLGVIAGEIQGFETSFTPEMSNAAEELRAALRATSADDREDALQAFLFSLFSQKRCGDVSKYTFLAYSFLAIYSFSEDGTLQPCNSFTQYFSETVFFARAAIFNRIVSDAKRDKMGFFE